MALRTRIFLLVVATLVLGIATAQLWNVVTVHAKSSKQDIGEQRLMQLQAEVLELRARVVRLEARAEDQNKPRITPLTQR